SLDGGICPQANGPHGPARGVYHSDDAHERQGTPPQPALQLRHLLERNLIPGPPAPHADPAPELMVVAAVSPPARLGHEILVHDREAAVALHVLRALLPLRLARWRLVAEEAHPPLPSVGGGSNSAPDDPSSVFGCGGVASLAPSGI